MDTERSQTDENAQKMGVILRNGFEILPAAAAAATAGRGTRCSVLGIEEWNGEMELRALPDFALDPDASAVDLYKVLGAGQPAGGTADLTRTRGVDAIKTFENARLIGLRDADAGIGDGEDDFAVVGLRADHDLSARQRVLGRVIQQILQNLGQQAAVAGDFRQIFGDIDGNADVFFRGAMLRSFQAALDELRNADGAYFELQAVGVHLRKFEQVVGQPGGAPGVRESDG